MAMRARERSTGDEDERHMVDEDGDGDDDVPGENNLSPMDPLGAENGEAWREDHQEDHHDAGDRDRRVFFDQDTGAHDADDGDGGCGDVIEQKCFQNKMKELDLKEKSSKSLLANVLDMDDDFVPSSSLPAHPPTHQKNGGFIRWATN